MLEQQKIMLQTPGMALFDPATLSRFMAAHGIEATDLLQYFNDHPAVGDAAIRQGCLLPIYTIPAWDYQLVFNDTDAISTPAHLIDAVLDVVLPLTISSGTLIVTDLSGIMAFDLDYYLNFPPPEERLGLDAEVKLEAGNHAVRVVKFMARQDRDLEHRACGYEFLLKKVASLPALAHIDVDAIPYAMDVMSVT